SACAAAATPKTSPSAMAPMARSGSSRPAPLAHCLRRSLRARNTDRSDLSIAARGLSGGVFTDPSGAVFTGYSNATTTDTLAIAGTALAQNVNGTNSGIQITLPANTYGIALILTTVSGFGSQQVVVNGRD